ncbi:MAG: GH92 family glycosyl hydrolase [Flavobacteriaceae bacterium]
MKKLLLLFIGLMLWGCQEKTSPYFLVDPFIGTGGHGHTYPGATLPFGMVQMSPDSRLDGWDGCSGYHNSDDQLYGFSHTHLSGTGISDYGDILFMPYDGTKRPVLDSILIHGGIISSFDKTTEMASPGYYKVDLKDSKTTVELTASKRVGIQKYRFHKANKKPEIFLNLQHRDILLDYHVEQINDTTIQGYRRSKAWAQDQHVYFYTTFSESVKLKKYDIKNDKYFYLELKDDLTLIEIKTALSSVNLDGAKKNYFAETDQLTFDQIHSQAKKVWKNELDKIQVTGDHDEEVIFYTSLYHSLIAPNIFNDVDGSYRGLDQKIYKDTKRNTYTVFSLWDTFRAAHPLYTLIAPEETTDFIHTFLKHYNQGGRLPVWELSANETDCMIGYHSVPVIYDAFNKGFKDFDHELALEAMVQSAEADGFGLESYKKYGYVAAQDEAESVSRTLEYAYDDWCIAQMALKLGKVDLYNNYIKRAQYYKNVFDSETGFMRARINAGWYKPFDPKEVNFNYTEANAWQYSMFVPQDITGLINLYGSKKKLEQHLDEMFSSDDQTTGRHQADITGLIGQYAHGNEPSHHMAYLYNYVDKPHKTQEIVSKIKEELYTTKTDGLSGNEDCGQMSAWYVFSSLGFYPVTPGSNKYIIGHPSFESAIINLENGKKFSIEKIANNANDKYINSISLNGQTIDRLHLSHQEIINGGDLVFYMSDRPNFEQKFQIDRPEIRNTLASSPVIDSKKKTFIDSLEIRIENPGNQAGEILYRMNNSDYKVYEGPFYIYESAEISATHSLNDKIESPISKISKASFVKVPKGRTIEIRSNYDTQYAAEGDRALIDYQRGGENFRTGYWQGYQGQNVEVIVDLGKTKSIQNITSTYLQDTGSWIWFPSKIEYFYSIDGVNFRSLESIETNKSIKSTETELLNLTSNKSVNARFIKLIAYNRGPCPPWHQGAGGASWIFIDELEIN